MTDDLKTKPTQASVEAFLRRIGDEDRRKECVAVLGLMKKATGMAPRMWGSSIVGFGSYHYKYASGREGDWFLVGFAPRKQDLTLYITDGLDRYQTLLGRLGRHKTGKSCLYVKRLADLDLGILEELIAESAKRRKKIGRA